MTEILSKQSFKYSFGIEEESLLNWNEVLEDVLKKLLEMMFMKVGSKM